MPQEERYIKFNYNEVLKAVRIYGIEMDKDTIPAGKLNDVKIDKDSSDQNFICTIENEEGETIEKELDKEFFVMSLVYACQAHDIPLPKNAAKHLSVQDGVIIMIIKFEDAA